MNTTLTIDSNIIALASLGITLVCVLWNILFGYGKMVASMDTMRARMDTMQESIVDIKQRMDRMDERMEKGFRDVQADIHKLDIRVTRLEQRKRHNN